MKKSLFLLRHKSALQGRHNKSNSGNTPYIPHISKLPQSTSCAIENHSGVKTCRVAETRAPQLTQKWACTLGRGCGGSEFASKVLRVESEETWDYARESELEGTALWCFLHSS